MIFEELRLEKQMLDLVREIESINNSNQEISEEYWDDLQARKTTLLTQYYQKYGNNIVPLVF